ncbi:NAD(P)H-binding protein [Granulicella sp. S156]|jgi:uncharacterized protein YbjT (DUF2867 family)|uniref:NmrA family NAD(P)-binding protein n=1 Tax=Granulicella sp. S156 TaxID=1747224 RepID=UPI00131E9F54|nr:NAD(P)H-binding protein [Granulicella sp. S156]
MIVVTAPTSNIGSQVLENILDSGESIRVIARDPSRMPEQTRKRVEVVEGSHSDLDVVTKAFQGADSVFWLVPADPRAESAEAAYVDFARPGCEAFKSQGVKRVVGISALGRGWPKNAGHVTATLAMDDMIAHTGVSYRALTCPGFIDNMLRQVEVIKSQGMFSWPISGDLKAPTCATRDIASVAARLLLDRSWSGVGSLPILGPEDLSFNDIAQIMSEVLGKPVRFEETAVDALKTRLLSRGMSEGMTQAMINMLVAKNEGMDNREPRTPQSTTPTSFRQWCEEVLKPAVLN